MDNPVIGLLRARHGSRSFRVDPVPEEIVGELVEAARLTPSCMNNQPWRYLFLSSPEALEKGRQALSKGNFPWAGRAPLLIVGYAREADDCAIPDGRRYHQFDLGMATMDLMLAATARDLVARPFAGFSPAKLKELFPEHLSDADQPLVMLAVGYLSENEDHIPPEKRGMEQKPRSRKDASEIVRRL
jgi:glutaredoxin-dependent peroxiredoxin